MYVYVFQYNIYNAIHGFLINPLSLEATSYSSDLCIDTMVASNFLNLLSCGMSVCLCACVCEC